MSKSARCFALALATEIVNDCLARLKLERIEFVGRVAAVAADGRGAAAGNGGIASPRAA